MDLPSPITFEWEKEEVDGYELQGFENGVPFFQRYMDSGITRATRSFPARTEVEWWVVTLSADARCPDPSKDSEHWRLTVGESPCPISTPSLISPKADDTVPEPVIFEWGIVEGALGYNVYAGLPGEPKRLNEVLLGSGDSRLKSPVVFGPGLEIEWYVQALGPKECTVTSSPRRFKTPPCPSSPTLNAPSPGQTGLSGLVTLSWNPVPNADSYRVLIGLNGSPPGTETTTTQTSYTRSFPIGVKVDWNVAAVRSGCNEALGAGRTFFMACPIAPVPKEPGNNTTSPTTAVTMTWTPAEGATGQRLLLSRNSQPTSIDLPATANSHTDTFNPGDTVDWQVISLAYSNCTVPGPTFRFTVAAAVICPEKVSLISPGPDQTNVADPVRFTWEAADVAGYDLYVNREKRNSTPIPATAAPTFQVSVGRGVTAEWYVVGLPKGDCKEIASETRRFSTSEEECPGAANLLLPPNGATNVSPIALFAWEAVKGAAGYHILIGLNGAPLKQFNSEPLPPDTTKFEAEVGRGVRVEWAIVTLTKASCGQVESVHRTFTTEGATCPLAANLFEPVDGATGVPDTVVFTWEQVKGAVGYDILIGLRGQLPRRFNEGTIPADRPSFKLEIGAGVDVVWQVVTLTTSPCQNQTSAQRRFRTGDACPGAAGLVSPFANATNLPEVVTFSWNQVNNAVGYNFYIQPDGSGEPKQLNDFMIPPETTSWTERLGSGFSGVWFVETLVKDPCTSAISERRAFRTAQSCPTPFNLSAPENGANVNTIVVNYSWPTVTGATGYNIYIGINGAEPTKANSAKVPSNGWSAKYEANTRVQWFVEALADAPCTSVFSAQRFTFTTVGECPVAVELISPKNGATRVTDPVTFSWTLSPLAAGYNIYIGRNSAPVRANDALIGPEENQWIDKVGQNTRVEWFVEVVGKERCETVRSATFSFTSAGTRECPPAETVLKLASPESGASLSSPVSFSWDALAGTSGYRLWYVPDNGSQILLGTTSALSLTVPVAAGSGFWYLEATFEGCKPVLSEQRKIEIRRSASCENRTAEPTSPREGERLSSPISFKWAEAANAIGYKLFLSFDGIAFEDVVTTRSTEASVELKPGTVAWLVETHFNGCEPLRSLPRRFEVIGAGCSTEMPRLILPADNASQVSSPVNFSWGEVKDAIGYRLFVASDGEFVEAETTREPAAQVKLEPGVYQWYVESFFERCRSTLSDKREFTIPRQTNCPSDRPSPLAPENGSRLNDSVVDFSWSSVTGAVDYELWVQPTDGTPTLIADTPRTSARAKLEPDKYEYFIRARFDRCSSRESARAVFVIEIPEVCSDQRPELKSPSESSRVVVPPTFEWTTVAGASSYKLFASIQDGTSNQIDSTTATSLRTDVGIGKVSWYVEAVFPGNCGSTESARAVFFREEPATPCPTINTQILASVVGNTTSDSEYFIRWNELAGVDVYEVQEAGNPSFDNAETHIVTANSVSRKKTVDALTTLYYRVRGRSKCDGTVTAFSPALNLLITPSSTNETLLSNSVEVGTGEGLIQTFVLFGAQGTSFTATADQPWITIDPSSGSIPAAGQITISIISDPSALGTGTHEATVTINTSAATKTSLEGGKNSVPVSVSLVTPVTPVAKNSPPPDALIIPVVAHAEGANNSLFESDVRVTNITASPIRYQISFTPSETDATLNGRQTTVDVSPGGTLALDDILRNFFGIGTVGQSASGSLEIRPLNIVASANPHAAQPKNTVASSRTYNFTPDGTFGQFIPAVAFRDFVGRLGANGVPDVLSLQQIAQSAAYRTNFGIVEGSGEAADVVISVFDANNVKVKDIPLSLKPGEHKQINGILALNNVLLTDGRMEVQVTSDKGRVTAYASVVDNKTNDPMLVSAVPRNKRGSTRYVVPGVADLDAALANFRTDMRIFNASNAPVNATLEYYEQGQSAVKQTITKQLKAGEVIAMDDVLRNQFGLTGTGGVIQIKTAGESNLIATARTYSLAENGSFGQFIPAVTSADAVGFGERALQVLQMEESERFRSNLGLVEVTGEPVSLEISAYVSGSKSAPRLILNLGANEFRQMGQVLKTLGVGAAYNSRLSVKVVGGKGRVAAYGSMIDNQTQDPTYVPAQ